MVYMPRTHRDAIPPEPIVSNLSLTDWLVGCALSNPDVTRGLDHQDAIENAMIYATGAIAALRSPRVPDRVDPPSDEEMMRWSQIINNLSRETARPGNVTDDERASTIPVTPEESGFRPATRPIKKHG